MEFEEKITRKSGERVHSGSASKELLTVALCEVSSLTHEVWNHTMKWTIGVAVAIFSGTKLLEIFTGLWYN